MKKLFLLLTIIVAFGTQTVQAIGPINLKNGILTLDCSLIRKAFESHPIIATALSFVVGIGYTKWCSKQAQVRTNITNIIHHEVLRFNAGCRTPTHSLPALLVEAQKCTNYPFLPNWKLMRLIKEFYAAFINPTVTAANIERLRDQIQDRLHASF